jgi:hypothetical protein
MKNRLFLFCLLFLPFISSAQESYRRQENNGQKNIKLGFTLSPNISWMRVTNPQNSSLASDGARAGINYGVLADFGFDKNYFFSTAFTVTSVNGKLRDPQVADALSTIYKLQYIEIPLTLKLKTNPTDLARFYGQFGLGTGIKISGKETGGSTEGSINYTSTTGKIFRASLVVGAGAEWILGPNLNLQTGLTLNHGLTNTISSSYDIKSDYLALSLGIFF